jgi:hypothetical protein
MSAMNHFDDVHEHYASGDDFSPRYDTLRKRVTDAYPVLKEVATDRETIAYSDLADQINTDERRYLAYVLGTISRMEHRENDLRPSVLVVGANSGRPSDEFFRLLEYLDGGHPYPSLSDEEIFQREKERVYEEWV